MLGRFVEAGDCARAAATKAMSATEAATAGKRCFRFKFILSLSRRWPYRADRQEEKCRQPMHQAGMFSEHHGNSCYNILLSASASRTGTEPSVSDSTLRPFL